jgi:hypothetical protein
MLMEFMKSNNIDLSKLMCMVSDGAPSCVGKNRGLIDLPKQSESIPPFIHYNCLIHTESLSSRLKSVTNFRDSK